MRISDWSSDVCSSDLIGVATSRDLKTWRRHPGNPILKVGAPGSNDARFVANPCVMRHNGLWVMYYYGYTSRRGARDLLAIGRDPFHFEKVTDRKSTRLNSSH